MNKQIKLFKDKIFELNDIYYGNVAHPQIKISHPVDEEIEKYVMNFHEQRIINEYAVAWKFGTLVKQENKIIPREKNGNYLSGYGIEIDKIQLLEYLQRVRDNIVIKEMNFEEIYTKLHKLQPPKYFGSVYMINILFFLSGGDWPIYDRFAHKAAKAIFMELHPSQIYMCAAPSKDKICDVVNLYMEYIWLLERLFGRKNINRETDRALWVYGHASEGFNL